ncbi:MFS transporter [Ramlibacter sp. PS3R-8]|uniref:MFS transporter n=1 Tax=Ramlibacter sp. PS3R-8 TaxID=3133437 RepID=UPI0030A490BB
MQPLSGARFSVLLAAALVVSMGYGVTLPLLPGVLEPLVSRPSVAGHTGWLTAAFTLALVLFSPVWGAISDRMDRRKVIALGLAGTGLALWSLDLASSLPALYAARIVAGGMSAAVAPAVFSCMVDGTLPAQRQNRFAWVASAGALGFVLGPVVGNLLGDMVAARAGRPMLDSPFAIAAFLAFAAAAAVLTLPAMQAGLAHGHGGNGHERAIRQALPLTGLVLLAITVAEVGITLVSRDQPQVPPELVVYYFGICSAVMVLAQLWGYPWLERRLGEPRMVGGAFGGLAAALALLAWPLTPWLPALAFLLAGSSVGVLVPALAVRISQAAGGRQGWGLGRQAAASSFGQALGAAATGALYAVAPWLPFVGAAALVVVGALAFGVLRSDRNA